MSHNHPFIVIEGVDGVGKTTTARIIADLAPAAYICTPSGFWRRHRRLVENGPVSQRFVYYLLSSWWASFQVSRILKVQPVVCDRYLHSTWAHHLAEGCRLANILKLHSVPVLKPDLVFYLYATRAGRKKRVKNRKENTHRDLDQDMLETVHRRFLKLGGIIPVNTTEKTAWESAITIKKHFEIFG